MSEGKKRAKGPPMGPPSLSSSPELPRRKVPRITQPIPPELNMPHTSDIEYQSSFDPSSQRRSDDPIGSSSPAAYDNVITTDEDLQAISIARLEFSTYPEKARELLGRQPFKVEGWCKLVNKAPTKEGGYIQLSDRGANKFAILQEVVCWAGGKYLVGKNDQASHLCNHRACKVPEHLAVESAIKNNARKNCRVWVNCPHCPKKIIVCIHDPVCIKFCEGFDSMEDLTFRGVCSWQ
jgi:Zinc-binding loop region of homing endonuclease